MLLRRTWWKAAIFGITPFLAAQGADLIQVTGVRSWSLPDSTRIIIQTTGSFSYHSDQAVNPDRLFVDILHSRPWMAQKRNAVHEVGDNLVHRVRIAENAPGTTRIVFDLASPVDFSITTLDSPDRLVVELRPHGGKARVQSASAAPVVTPIPATSARTFAYPPPVSTRRAQVVFAGMAPPIALPPMDPDPLYFVDPVETFVAAVPSKPHLILRGAAASPAPDASPTPAASTRVLAAARITTSAGAAPTASENATKSLTRALGLKVNRIVIDAGHGGHDDGTIGPNGVMEKDVVLDVALRLAKIVQQRMGAEVVLTRSDDTFIPLQQRTAIANEHKADLFLSIHANSSPAAEVAGTETFFLNFTNSPDALNVAARENAGSEKSVGELKDLIQTITLNDKIEESHTFADNIQSAIQSQAARSNAAARNRGVKRAPFVVMIGASMPSVLAEIGFLSNARDENNLNKSEYRQKVAEALYKGLSQYAQSLSHFDMPKQPAPKQLAKTDPKTTEKPAPAGLN
jgi:N-acetylmuramoyl-L-alanine amidase